MLNSLQLTGLQMFEGKLWNILEQKNLDSENQFSGGGINKEMILNETCYYLNISFLTQHFLSLNSFLP